MKNKIIALLSVLLSIALMLLYNKATYHNIDYDILLSRDWLLEDLCPNLDFDLINISDTISYTPELEQKISAELQEEYKKLGNNEINYKSFDPRTNILYVNHEKIGYVVYVSEEEINIITLECGMIKGYAPGSHW